MFLVVEKYKEGPNNVRVTKDVKFGLAGAADFRHLGVEQLFVKPRFHLGETAAIAESEP